MGSGGCVTTAFGLSASDRVSISKDNYETYTTRKLRLSRMCCVVADGQPTGNVKLAIYYVVSGTTLYNYRTVLNGNPLISVSAGNNIIQSDRNWFTSNGSTVYAGVYQPTSGSANVGLDSSGGSGYWYRTGEVTEGNSNSFTDSSNSYILRVGFLQIDCSVSGSNPDNVSVGNTTAFYGNVNYQTWDSGYNQAYLNINAPWAIEGSGFSGFVTVGTYAYTTTTTESGTIYTYKVYITSANSSSVGYTEYLYVQPQSNDIYVNSSTGNDLNTGASCSVPVKTFTVAYSLINTNGTIHVCNSGADFSGETITFSKSWNTMYQDSGTGNFYFPFIS